MNWKKDISDYFRGKQTGKSANRLEWEALSDPFLFEALEGFEGRTEDCEEIFSVLDKKLQRRAAHGSRRFLYKWVVAASLVLVCGVAVMLLRVDSLDSGEQIVVVSQEVQVVPFSQKREMSGLGNADEGSGSSEKVNEEVKERKIIATNSPSTRANVTEQRARKAAVAVQASPQGQEDVLIETMEYGSAEDYESAENTGFKRIQGVVTDTVGRPLPGVSLRWLEGVREGGVVTDVNGYFMARVGDTVTSLMANFIGMKSERTGIPVNGILNIKMQQELTELSEMVVVGYGHAKKAAAVQVPEPSKKGAFVMPEPITAEEIQHFEQYVIKNLRYPADALRQKLEGSVQLSFRLNRQRQAGRIKVVKGISSSCDREAIRLLEQYKGWKTTDRSTRILITVRFQLPEK